MRYDWITFDCYGTLIDWEEGMRRTFGAILEGRSLSDGLETLIEKYVQYEMLVERRAYAPYRQVLAAASSLLFKQELDIDLTEGEAGLLASGLPGWKPFAEAPAALAKLKGRYKLAILSNIDDDLLAPSVAALGVEFDALITAEQVGSYKPIKNHWTAALARFGVREDRVFHVAASYLHDILPCKQMGIACAWINRKGEQVLGTVKPDLALSDLSSLPELLGA